MQSSAPDAIKEKMMNKQKSESSRGLHSQAEATRHGDKDLDVEAAVTERHRQH